MKPKRIKRYAYVVKKSSPRMKIFDPLKHHTENSKDEFNNKKNSCKKPTGAPDNPSGVNSK
jgi:hypothetical protein